MQQLYPTIDLEATGRNIRSLRRAKGLSVEDLRRYFDFNGPRTIYKWQSGLCLPSIDNLYALSVLLDVPMDRIIVGTGNRTGTPGPRDPSRGSAFFGFFLPAAGADAKAERAGRGTPRPRPPRANTAKCAEGRARDARMKPKRTSCQFHPAGV